MEAWFRWFNCSSRVFHLQPFSSCFHFLFYLLRSWLPDRRLQPQDPSHALCRPENFTLVDFAELSGLISRGPLCSTRSFNLIPIQRSHPTSFRSYRSALLRGSCWITEKPPLLFLSFELNVVGIYGCRIVIKGNTHIEDGTRSLEISQLIREAVVKCWNVLSPLDI